MSRFNWPEKFTPEETEVLQRLALRHNNQVKVMTSYRDVKKKVAIEAEKGKTKKVIRVVQDRFTGVFIGGVLCQITPQKLQALVKMRLLRRVIWWDLVPRASLPLVSCPVLELTKYGRKLIAIWKETWARKTHEKKVWQNKMLRLQAHMGD